MTGLQSLVAGAEGVAFPFVDTTSELLHAILSGSGAASEAIFLLRKSNVPAWSRASSAGRAVANPQCGRSGRASRGEPQGRPEVPRAFPNSAVPTCDSVAGNVLD